jgi:hypothetical protein
MNWYQYNEGNTIGSRGSENGIIVEDSEHIQGARITIERDGDIAPFAVTLGIYGLMFHTAFSSSIDEAQAQVQSFMAKVESIFALMDTPEPSRNEQWEAKYETLTNEIIAI